MRRFCWNGGQNGHLASQRPELTSASWGVARPLLNNLLALTDLPVDAEEGIEDWKAAKSNGKGSTSFFTAARLVQHAAAKLEGLSFKFVGVDGH